MHQTVPKGFKCTCRNKNYLELYREYNNIRNSEIDHCCISPHIANNPSISTINFNPIKHDNDTFLKTECKCGQSVSSMSDYIVRWRKYCDRKTSLMGSTSMKIKNDPKIITRLSRDTYDICKQFLVFYNDEICFNCGSGKNIEIDHIKPISSPHYGTNKLNNLQLLCKNCNAEKGDKFPFSFL